LSGWRCGVTILIESMNPKIVDSWIVTFLALAIGWGVALLASYEGWKERQKRG
jgi:hypothetical protein